MLVGGGGRRKGAHVCVKCLPRSAAVVNRKRRGRSRAGTDADGKGWGWDQQGEKVRVAVCVDPTSDRVKMPFSHACTEPPSSQEMDEGWRVSIIQRT